MESSDVFQKIREVNLAYLLLARRLVRRNQVEAMYRLGISRDMSDILGKLSSAQLLKLAAINVVLCTFRFEDHALLSSWINTKRHDLLQLHAAILLAQKPVKSLD